MKNPACSAPSIHHLVVTSSTGYHLANVSQDFFQKKLDHAYEGIPNVMSIADDIIAGSTPEEHDEALLSMFEASRKNNIGLNSEKLQFKASLVNFFGHTITSQGFEPAREVGQHQEPEGTCQQQRAPRCSRHDHVPQPILS